MDIYAELDALRPGLRAHAWDQAEARAAEACLATDPEAHSRITTLDLEPYRAQLTSAAERVAGAARDSCAAAVYWEFDLDNSWDSAFFLCASYSGEEEGDDDWASDYDEDGVVAGPSAPALAALYASTFNGTEADAARNALLIARTIVAFGKAVSGAWPADLPLCAGFHDQDLLFRIVEPG